MLPGNFGPLYSAVTVQNLEPLPIEIRLTRPDGRRLGSGIALGPRAARTFTASELQALGLFEGGATGSGLVIEGRFADESQDILGQLGLCDTDFDGSDCLYPAIAAVEKHARPAALGMDARTGPAQESVSGQTAVREETLAQAADGTRWVIPVIQTNNEWRTAIKVTNVSRRGDLSVTLTLRRNQGLSAGQAVYTLSQTLGNGQTWTIDLNSVAPPEWVGSAWIDAGDEVVAVAERYKPSWKMALTTEAAPRDGAPTTLYGALIFREYNGWNTGINLVNLDPVNANAVTLAYYAADGSVQSVPPEVSQITLDPGASAFIYRPDISAVPSLDRSRVNAVVITGSRPLAVAIDEVKYRSGPGQGQAMSYLAQGRPQQVGKEVYDRPTTEARTFGHVSGRYWYTQTLALPLFQVGDASGLGDVSGIELFNPGGQAQRAYVQFLRASGAPEAPTASGSAEAPAALSVLIPAGGHAIIYPYDAAWSGVPRGFTGTALVGVDDEGGGSGGFLVGISNNVNYAVNGDGSAVYALTSSVHGPLTLSGVTLELTPASDSNAVNADHTLTAELRAGTTALRGRSILFRVTRGNSVVDSDTVTTGTNGQAEFEYTNDEAGTDTITACWDVDGSGTCDPGEPSDTASKAWYSATLTLDDLGETVTVRTTPAQTGYFVPQEALASSDWDVPVICDLSPDRSGVRVLLRFTTTGGGTVTGEWAGGSPGSSGVKPKTTDSNGRVTDTLTLLQGSNGNTFVVSCYLDKGTTGSFDEDEDQLLASQTIYIGTLSFAVADDTSNTAGVGGSADGTATVTAKFGTSNVQGVRVALRIEGDNDTGPTSDNWSFQSGSNDDEERDRTTSAGTFQQSLYWLNDWTNNGLDLISDAFRGGWDPDQNGTIEVDAAGSPEDAPGGIS
ncbi:Ig-like domain-containing protein [Thermomicrobiaceae bacterium CFH 74404]|uniref:Ig-like domain-containing protein n=1 Tax=Thermalbibacter longus TaxID=2951981 RepID=A0AA41WE33_9BACT|nr:Ig-like domain-containing protein [Thermalbibacter longus]MCM8749408.1 Ig-like domain-containing protein [Thermalbibacter longus]